MAILQRETEMSKNHILKKGNCHISTECFTSKMRNEWQKYLLFVGFSGRHSETEMTFGVVLWGFHTEKH